MSASAALREVGIEPTASKRRFAARLLRQYRETGTVLGQRSRREPRVMIREVTGIVEGVMFARRTSSIRMVWMLVAKKIHTENDRRSESGVAKTLRVPSYQTVRRFVRRLECQWGGHDRLARDRGATPANIPSWHPNGSVL